MMSENIYEVVECAYSQDKHLLHEAVALSCGHYICKKCIPEANNKITCLKCKTINTNDLSTCKESQVVKYYMNNHLKDLTELIQDKISNEIEILKCIHSFQIIFLKIYTHYIFRSVKISKRVL